MRGAGVLSITQSDPSTRTFGGNLQFALLFGAMPRAVRTDIVQPDGRHVHLYGDFTPAPAGYQAPAMPNGVYERRWNPLRREWVLVAASRQARTFLPERADCPLCPSRPGHSTEIPAAGYGGAVFENRFPAMVPWPPAGGASAVGGLTRERGGEV